MGTTGSDLVPHLGTSKIAQVMVWMHAAIYISGFAHGSHSLASILHLGNTLGSEHEYNTNENYIQMEPHTWAVLVFLLRKLKIKILRSTHG